MKKKIWIALFLLGMLCMAVPVQAAEQPSAAKGRILFVPHDGRPISDAQTAPEGSPPAASCLSRRYSLISSDSAQKSLSDIRNALC